MGRTTKLTDQLRMPGADGVERMVTRHEAILELIRQGCTQRVAALRAGVSESTFYRWRDRGLAARSGPYRKFVDDLDHAQAIAEATLTLRMKAHANADWRACAWMLERRFPDTWRERKTVDATVTTPPGPPPQLVVQLGAMTPAQLAALSGCDLDGMDGLRLPTDTPAPPDEPAADDDTDT